MDKKYFKNEETNQLFGYWIKNYPLSLHPLDLDRWNKFVLSALENEEDISYDIIRGGFKDFNHHDKDDRYIDIYMSKYSSMKDLYEILKTEDKLK